MRTWTARSFKPATPTKLTPTAALVSHGYDPYGELAVKVPGDTGLGIVGYFNYNLCSVICGRLRDITPPAITKNRLAHSRWTIIDSLDKEERGNLEEAANNGELVSIHYDDVCMGFVIKANQTALYLILAVLNQGPITTKQYEEEI